ncbi:uncharacterized protein LOC119507775 [Choloepus didactylus]|uniref:uncharacterized protein LOC119507775 n=1 Tax=Choloepus didactylus TaxID=27675 RepID=UPI00189D2521|nr:uncharacterized protein LOC119507775 [Choloepus didactylus]
MRPLDGLPSSFKCQKSLESRGGPISESSDIGAAKRTDPAFWSGGSGGKGHKGRIARAHESHSVAPAPTRGKATEEHSRHRNSKCKGPEDEAAAEELYPERLVSSSTPEHGDSAKQPLPRQGHNTGLRESQLLHPVRRQHFGLGFAQEQEMNVKEDGSLFSDVPQTSLPHVTPDKFDVAISPPGFWVPFPGDGEKPLPQPHPSERPRRALASSAVLLITTSPHLPTLQLCSGRMQTLQSPLLEINTHTHPASWTQPAVISAHQILRA